MHKIVDNLTLIQNEIQTKIEKNKFQKYKPNIIAGSKTFPMNDIIPLINHGHLHFGENKVQEAIEKWSSIKEDFAKIKLHMIGKLQTNKVKFVLPLFDYIHSLDNIRLAEKIANEQEKKNKKVKIFIQVNIGSEDQKNGIEVENLQNFLKACIEDFKLNIIGLMCLPPSSKSSKEYFLKMRNLTEKMNLNEISMGMSKDYLEAVDYKSTYLRIGSKLFGSRD
jgi:pyridoxal phosphate enzyme (YggS family)